VAGINAAASFDKKAIRQRGEYLGEEFRGKGANVYLGPDVNLVRSPYAGRNFETFGEDPFLSGVAGVETILGVQSKGVVSHDKAFCFLYSIVALIDCSSEACRSQRTGNLENDSKIKTSEKLSFKLRHFSLFLSLL
jgi:hypothetical protein